MCVSQAAPSLHLAVLFGLGDVIAQTITKEKGERYDLPRLGRAWVFGTFILGPLAHWHFNFLEYLVVKRVRGVVSHVRGCGLVLQSVCSLYMYCVKKNTAAKWSLGTSRGDLEDYGVLTNLWDDQRTKNGSHLNNVVMKISLRLVKSHDMFQEVLQTPAFFPMGVVMSFLFKDYGPDCFAHIP